MIPSPPGSQTPPARSLAGEIREKPWSVSLLPETFLPRAAPPRDAQLIHSWIESSDSQALLDAPTRPSTPANQQATVPFTAGAIDHRCTPR
ncbi:hypothetical protein BHE90_017475, partial [Fusarium euwallaceae]